MRIQAIVKVVPEATNLTPNPFNPILILCERIALALPFKRNPANAENVDSLARLVAALPRVAWGNAAHSLPERTLDDMARVIRAPFSHQRRHFT